MSGHNFGSPDLRLPLLATQRDSDPFHQARTSSGDRDNDSAAGGPGEDSVLADGSTHAPWTPNESPRSVQARSRRLSIWHCQHVVMGRTSFPCPPNANGEAANMPAPHNLSSRDGLRATGHAEAPMRPPVSVMSTVVTCEPTKAGSVTCRTRSRSRFQPGRRRPSASSCPTEVSTAAPRPGRGAHAGPSEHVQRTLTRVPQQVPQATLHAPGLLCRIPCTTKT